MDDTALDTTLALRAPTLAHMLESYGLRVYYADLHNHTAASDGVGQTLQALQHMHARGLHVAAVTDHGEHLERNAEAWTQAARHTETANSADFLALRGFEWSSPLRGHINVWCSADYTGWTRTGDETLATFYEWLATAPPAGGAQVLAGFNHPGRETGCFDDFAFVPAMDDQIVTCECFNRHDDYGEGYFRALNAGWHVGAAGNADHHSDDWGGATARTGILAPVFSLSHLLAALQARRIFATRSHTLALLLTGNGAPMGTRLALRPGEPLLLNVWCADPALTDGAQLECWTNNSTLVASCNLRGTSQLTWNVHVDTIGTTEQWFVIRVQRDNVTLAYSSPIWARHS